MATSTTSIDSQGGGRFAGTIAVIALGCAAQAFAGQVRITDLGTFSGGSSSAATGISANGIVVGYSTKSDGNGHAFVYSGGVMHDVGNLGTSSDAAESLGWAVNSFGYAAGTSMQNGRLRAFEWDGNAISPVGVLPTDHDAEGVAINERGDVAASTGIFSGHHVVRGRAYLYSAAGLTSIAGPANWYVAAAGLNNNEQVVGTMVDLNNTDHAFLFDPATGHTTDLGTLGGGSSATAINDNGQIVGYSQIAGSIVHAFLYSGNSMVDLGTGTSESRAKAISADGHVVGTMGDGFIQQQAFMYYGGIVTDLNTLLPANSGWDIVDATGINDSGQIVGTGYINGQSHAYLLELNGASDPVSETPEPGTWALLLAGCGAAALRRRFR